MEEKSNPLICDPVDGVCALPDSGAQSVMKAQKTDNLVRVVYFTDPICSSCWGIEPQLRRLHLEYGNTVAIEYHMGGLLPDWSYNSGGISKPSDVAHHWDEVSRYYDMPIDGDVWLQDPLPSSYPPSIAFKAAQLQSPDKALLLLREMREMVFLHKINIAKWDNIAIAAQRAGLNIAQLQTDVAGRGKTLFEEDLALARQYGVRGFPTMFFVNAKGEREMVYGSKPYDSYASAVRKLHPASVKNNYGKAWEQLFSIHHSLTAREFAELSGMSRKDSEALLIELTRQGHLEQWTTKNGAIWLLKAFAGAKK